MNHNNSKPTYLTMSNTLEQEQEFTSQKWTDISGDPDCIYFIENHLYNTPDHLQKIDWTALSANFEAVHILENNMHKIDWVQFSTNCGAIHILSQNIEKIHWPSLCKNSAAKQLLKANPTKWNSLECDIDSDFYDDAEIYSYLLK